MTKNIWSKIQGVKISAFLSYLERDQTQLLLATRYQSQHICSLSQSRTQSWIESRKLSLGKIKLDQVCANSQLSILLCLLSELEFNPVLDLDKEIVFLKARACPSVHKQLALIPILSLPSLISPATYTRTPPLIHLFHFQHFFHNEINLTF